MADLLTLFADPAVWAALLTLIVLEVVLGIDNLVFVAILSNKLPPEQQARARKIGIGLALVLRLVLLFAIAWIIGLQSTLFDLGLTGPPGAHGEPLFETAISGRDLILIVGGLFLVWKATKEIHHAVDDDASGEMLDKKGHVVVSFGATISQIALLNLVFSIDSILTAIGMTDDVPVMAVAVVITVAIMFFAAGPLAHFIERNPTVVMLALAFLLMIGAVLIADGFGAHVPKGYIYAAMGFSVAVELLNIVGRNARKKRTAPASSETVA